MGCNLAIAGVTGAVGQEFLQILDERNFPFDSVKMLASSRSAGKTITFKNKEYIVEELTKDSFEGIDIALFSAGAGRSREFGPAAVEAGRAGDSGGVHGGAQIGHRLAVHGSVRRGTVSRPCARARRGLADLRGLGASEALLGSGGGRRGGVPARAGPADSLERAAVGRARRFAGERGAVRGAG